MKRSFIAASVVALAACGGSPQTANVPVTPQPTASAPGPIGAQPPVADTPPTTDGDVTTGSVNGIQILVKRTPGAAFVAGGLYIRGGVRNWTAASAGIEALALDAATSGGTKSLDKTAYSRKLASLAAQIWGSAENDFSQIRMKAPLDAWDATFALLVDVFRNPALPGSEIELARTRALAELHRELQEPDGQLWTLERKQVFTGHPYANRPTGTIDSVTALKGEDFAPYLDKLRETSRLLFVAVGDIDPAHVFDQVKQALGDLPRGAYVDSPLPPIAFDKTHLAIDTRKLPTNYVESAFVAPRWSDPDYVTGLVAMSGLSWRLFQEVRTKRNLTYAVRASSYDSFAYPLGMLYVTAVDPNAAMKVILEEAKRLRDEPIPETELAGFKAAWLTGYLQRHETPDGQAAALAEAQLLGGDWHIARAIPERSRAVTAADVQAYAKKYFVHLQAAVVGDPTKIDATLFTSL